MDTNSEKAQAQFKKNYDKHVRFEPRFTPGNYVFIKRPALLASAVNSITYEGDAKLLTRSAARSYVFVERHQVLAYAAEDIVYERCPKLLPHSTGPCRVIGVGSDYNEMVHDGIQNTISIKRLAKVAKDTRSNLEVTFDSGMNADIYPAKET